MAKTDNDQSLYQTSYMVSIMNLFSARNLKVLGYRKVLLAFGQQVLNVHVVFVLLNKHKQLQKLPY